MSASRFVNLATAYPVRKERSENGRPICRYCGGEVPKGRRTICSEKCKEELLVRSASSWVRVYVRRRDKGVCALCGLDTQRLKRDLDRRYGKGEISYDQRQEEYRRRGFDPWKSLWEADHITPVVRGGGACGLENYRTLCVPCHKKATARLAAERAAERQAAKKVTSA